MFFAPRAIRRNQSGGQPARKPGGELPGASPPHQATTDSADSNAAAAFDDGADAASLKRKSRWDAKGPNGVPKLSSSATAATASRATTAANSERQHDATTEQPSPSVGNAPVRTDSSTAASSLASNGNGAGSHLDEEERKRKHREAIQAKLQRGSPAWFDIFVAVAYCCTHITVCPPQTNRNKPCQTRQLRLRKQQGVLERLLILPPPLLLRTSKPVDLHTTFQNLVWYQAG